MSFIIVSRDEASARPAIEALARLHSDPSEHEILLAIGCNPSLQRNEASKRASGDYLVFLDNDSVADPRLLQYFEDALSYEEGIGIVGGPSVYSGKSSIFKAAVQQVFCSVFGLGPFRSRYMSVGQVRRTTERELILCNMLISRKLFLEEEGFDARLYPNEENEFLNRVQAHSKIYYHPLAICYRDPRKNLPEFMRQTFSYGAGRARDLMLFPQFWNSIFFIPIAFSAYMMIIPVGLATLAFKPSLWLLAPAVVYLVFDLSASIFAVLGSRDRRVLPWMPLLFLICHFFYGIGLVYGIVTHSFAKPKVQGQVEVLTLKRFEDRLRA